MMKLMLISILLPVILKNLEKILEKNINVG